MNKSIYKNSKGETWYLKARYKFEPEGWVHGLSPNVNLPKEKVVVKDDATYHRLKIVDKDDSEGLIIVNPNDGTKNKVFVIISEGELYEGSTWESLLFASHNKLDNLCVIIDVNQLIILGKTKDCLNLESIEKKMQSFNFDVSVCNGHDLKAIEKALTKKNITKKPKCIICNTIKGKGSSIMENKPNWHYWNKLTEREISKTRKELS